MKRILKKVISISLVIASVFALLALTACGEPSAIEPKIDEILKSDNYTLKITNTDNPTVTVKVSDTQIYVCEETKESKQEQYLYRNNDKYYYVTAFKNADETEGAEKKELKHDEYLSQYLTLLTKYAANDKLFEYKNVLQMAEMVSENNYRYSDNVYRAGFSSKTVYLIRLEGESLSLVESYDDSLKVERRYEIVYSSIGSTKVAVPTNIKNLK